MFEAKVIFKCINSLENNSQFTKFRVFTHSLSLVLTIWNNLPTYSKMLLSYFLGTVAICGVWINILLSKLWMHLSIKFCRYAFKEKTLFSLLTSWWNFKESKGKSKQGFNNLFNTPKLNSTGIKLMKLVHIPLNISFLKTLIRNFLFSQNILTSTKESDPFISVSIDNFMFLCFWLIFSRKNVHVLIIKQNKFIICISFVINCFEIFWAIVQLFF